MRISLAVNGTGQLYGICVKCGLYLEKMGFYSQCHIKTCLFFDIHSKYILPINKGSEQQMFIHLKSKYEAAVGPEVSSRTLIFSSNKTHKNFENVKVWFVYAF